MLYFSMVVDPNSDSNKIVSLVSSLVEGSEVNRVHGKELDITIPQSGIDQFPGKFNTLKFC